MKIAMIGTGYVGLVSGTCLAEIGHEVICVDNDEEKIRILKEGGIPIYEPGLEELVKRNVAAGRLSFTTSIEEGVKKSLAIFIAVGTPPREDGEPDLSAVERVSQDIGKAMESYRLIIEKSTVPVQTGRWIRTTITRFNKKGIDFDVASNPEFLREGSAVNDFLKPDRIVIGVESERARKLMLEIYQPIEAKKIVTDIESAELIKHASNSFLAMKISFINAISIICEKSGADVVKVAEGMGSDKRIGMEFLRAGVGFGGFCFPKDLRAFIGISKRLGYDFRLLEEVERINLRQQERVIEKLKEILWNLNGKTIGLLGLSFKPNTDDMRFAPSIRIAQLLKEEGAKVRGYDPVAMENAKKVMPFVTLANDPYQVCQDADGLVLVTEWEEFEKLDFERIKGLMRQAVIVDGRNLWDRKRLEELGFIYQGFGR
ncbi:UDP-glucose 6-dehydrogenase [candidate division WOR-3 bacterium]|uniref:UDP-glucose 6-dehydrogenase n=1 Tax=candidate division WOR-3 bacterium TaxID=2052148 RepID=A0A660SKG5_UNCW3|nr:MAG: UDP-glucose 6-dehydrogenase [candidate division WOR-3 bacterium]